MIRQPIFGRGMYLDTAVEAGQLVKITSNESVSLCETGNAHGVVWEAGEAGAYVTVELFAKGVVELVAKDAVTAGDMIEAATGGKGIKSTTESGVGVALTSATDGATFKLLVM